MKRSSGFSLITVLVIILIVVFLSAAAFDIASSLHSTAMSTITHEELYNAAQSGLEWGKSRLWENSGDLAVEFNELKKLDKYADLDAIRAKISGDLVPIDNNAPTDVNGISLDVSIFDCNYEYTEALQDEEKIEKVKKYDLPPVKLFFGDFGSGSGSINPQVGYSNLIDPNHNMGIGGNSGLKDHCFVIRSRAKVEDGRSIQLESMVVIKKWE